MKSSIWDERQEKLRAELKAFRVEAGLTQTEMAGKLKVSQSYVSKYERGELKLDFFEVCAVARACGISFRDFCARVEPIVK